MPRTQHDIEVHKCSYNSMLHISRYVLLHKLSITKMQHKKHEKHKKNIKHIIFPKLVDHTDTFMSRKI